MHLTKRRLGCAAATVLVAVLLAYLVAHRGVQMVVRNTGTRPMKNVRIELGGSQLAVGDIPAGGSAHGRLSPHSDSDVAISFDDTDSTSRTIRVDTYVTQGMTGNLNVDVQDGQLRGSKMEPTTGF